MSASKRPTRAPARASETAMFPATVVLPPPPLPEATATALRMGRSMRPRDLPSVGTLAVNWICTAATPGSASTAWRASRSLWSGSGAAGGAAARFAGGGDVGSELDLHGSPPRQRFHRLAGLPLDLVAQRTGRGGQLESKTDICAFDPQFLDHPQRDQVAPQLGLLHLTQRTQHQLLVQRLLGHD